MNSKNFEYLKDQLRYTGFGEGLQGQLKENLESGARQFALQHKTSYGKDELSSTLHFKKSDSSDLYFFNSYKASLRNSDSENALSQIFYINPRGGNISLKEAYNLLDGRAVNKDLINQQGIARNAWVQLDFSQTSQNGNFKTKEFSHQYGFDLAAAISRLPIVEVKDQQSRMQLFDSLRRGNRHIVTPADQSHGQKWYVEANPQFKAIIVYDRNLQKIRNPHLDQRQSEQAALAEKSARKNSLRPGF